MNTRRRILIISENPLFVDVIAQTFTDRTDIEPVKSYAVPTPGDVGECRPVTIIVDDAIEPAKLGNIVSAARQLPFTQILLMNLSNNDFVVLDAHRAVIREVNDLMETIDKDRAMKDQREGEPGRQPEIENARVRAGMYAFLAALYNQSPDTELVRRLRTIGIETFIQNSEGEGANPDINQGLREMAQYIEATLELPEEEVGQTLAVDWTRLFRGVNPNYGPPPPYEGVYHSGGGDPMEVLQAVNRIYHEQGATINDEHVNRPDYIGLELGFMNFLAERETEAWEGDEAESAREYLEVAEKFLQVHLVTWVASFVEKALEYAKTDFYRGFLVMTRGVLSEAVEQNMTL
jgi:TorA maturation chaperone TorD